MSEYCDCEVKGPIYFNDLDNSICCKCDKIRVVSEDKTDPLIHPWHPMTDPVDVKTLGKLGEESGELCQIVCRCLIQGIDETDPTKDITNREWLENELADVTANMALVEKRFGLDTERILKRALAKRKQLKIWHGMTKHYVASVDQIRNLASYGNSGKKIAEMLDCNVNTVRGMIAKHGIKTVSGRKLRHTDRNKGAVFQKNPFGKAPIRNGY